VQKHCHDHQPPHHHTWLPVHAPTCRSLLPLSIAMVDGRRY
jgi:hypothetical protein